MKIDLKQLPEGKSVTVVESESPEGLDLDLTGVHIVSPLEIKAEIFKLQDTLDIKISLKAQALTQCSRCLEEREVSIDKHFRLDYPLHKQDTSVDITEDIRQELMLEYPMKPLCSPDCKGLCMQCGKNLNEGDCKCISV